MKEISKTKLDYKLEIAGLSSPKIVKIMVDAKTYEGKIFEANGIKFMYKDGKWFIENGDKRRRVRWLL